MRHVGSSVAMSRTTRHFRYAFLAVGLIMTLEAVAFAQFARESMLPPIIQLPRAESPSNSPGQRHPGTGPASTRPGESFPSRRSLGSMNSQKSVSGSPSRSANPVRLLLEIEPVGFEEEVTSVQEYLGNALPPAPSHDRPPRVEIPYNFLDPSDRPTPEIIVPDSGPSASESVSEPQSLKSSIRPPSLEDCPPAPGDCGCPPRGLLAHPPKIPGLLRR